MAWESKLALDVIQTNFGSAVRCVAEALLELGPSSISETSRHLLTSSGCGEGAAEFAAADPSDVTRVVKAGLFVLLAHDCVACSLPVRVVGGGPGDVVSPAAAARAAAAAKKAAKLLIQESNPGGGRRKGGSSAAAAAAAAALNNGEVEAIEVGSTLRYEFRPAGAVRRLRFPLFLAAIRAAAGADAALIVEILFAHGPWTQHGLISTAVSKTRDLYTLGGGESHIGLYARFSKAFNQLQSLGFVTKHEGLHHPFPTEYKASTIKNLASTSSSSSSSAMLTALVSEDSVTASAIRLEVPTGSRKRPYSAVAETTTNTTTARVDEEQDTLGQQGATLTSTTLGIDRNEEEIDNEDTRAEAICTERGGKSTVIRFSWETGKQYLRNSAILRLVRLGSLKTDEEIQQTTLIIQAMMLVSLESVAGAAPAYRKAIMTAQLVSQPLEVSFILKKVRRLAAAAASASSLNTAEVRGGWTIDRVFTALMELVEEKRCTAPVRAVDIDESIPMPKRTFSIVFSLATDAVQLRTVESIIAERYNESSARIFRMLLEKGMLDEKYVSDKALLEPKTARMLLFKMVSDGLLTSQELPRRPDRNPQHTIYLFNAHWDRVLSVLADETCRSVLFLRIRLEMEKKRLEAAKKTGLKHLVTSHALHKQKTTTPGGGGVVSSSSGSNSSSNSISSSGAVIIDLLDDDDDDAVEVMKSSPSPSIARTTVDEQADELLVRMEKGVTRLETSILRIAETLFILSEL
jgi:hypothetical protein